MRHQIAGNRLGRNSSWRKATIRDLAKSTLVHERITTTEAKAKEARKLVDKLITLGKKGSLAHKRRAFAILCDHKLVSDLFTKIAIRFEKRPGGYTRIIKLAENRRGDNARMVLLELTERDQAPLQDGKKGKKASRKKEAAEVGAAGTKETHAAEHSVREKSSRKVVEKKEKDKGGGLKKIFRRKNPE